MEKEPGLTLLLGRETTAVLSEFIRSSPKSFTPPLHLPPSPYVWLLQASALETPDRALFQMECTVLKTLGSAENNYPKRLFALLCYGISDKPVFIELVCTFYIAILKYLRKQMKVSTEETDRLMWSEHKRKQCPYNLIFVSDLHS